MGAPEDLLPLTIREHDNEWQPIHETYAAAQQFIQGQARQCPQVGETDDEACQACLMFISRALAEDEHAARRLWPLSKIVTTCGTNLYDFFRELPVKAAVLEPFLADRGAKWARVEVQNNIQEWQKTLISLTLLSKKFKDLAMRFIPSTPVPRQAALRFGWFLFLNIKAKLLPPFPDLVSCMTVLTCIINLLVAHAPKPPECMLSQQQAAGQPLDTLQAICGDLKMDAGSTLQQMAAVDLLVSHLLPNMVADWRSSDRVHPAAAELKTHCSYFRGLLNNPSILQQCIEGLDSEYCVLYQSKGEIDEREFLLRDFSSMASPRLSPTSLYNAAKRVHLSGPPVPALPATGTQQSMVLGPGAFTTASAGQQRQPASGPAPGLVPGARPVGAGSALGLQSPVPIMRLAAAGPGATPVTEAMAASSWLRATIADAGAEPSPSLRQHLEAAGGSAMIATVTKRAWDLAEAAMPDERPNGGASVMGFPHVQSSLHALRRSEAVKLYFLVLEAVVMGEKASGDEAVRLLLGAVKFHKGLMACCLEVIITSFKMVSCNFPHVLDRLKLKAFELSKVIQPFVKYMPTMPRDLKRHLFVIEERILESLAWEPASPLYNLIVQAAGQGAGAAKPAAAPAPAVQPALFGPESAAQSDDMPAAGSAAEAASVCTGASPAGSVPEGGMAVAGSSPSRAGSGSAAPSPKRSGLQELASPSPLKKARCGERPSAAEAGIVPLSLVLPSPLPLAVGKPTGGVLKEFFTKVMKLMAFRLALLVDNFDFSPLDGYSAHRSIEEVLEQALYHETHLFYNRHIDQLVMCALYGYCKVHKLTNQVSFKDIIDKYRRQPQATQAVFRSVNLEQVNPGLIPLGQNTIIEFYNQCFVPVMKPYLLGAVQPSGTGAGGQQGNQVLHLGLPPMPPNPRHAQQAKVRRMSVPAPSAIQPPLRQQQQQQPQTFSLVPAQQRPAGGGGGQTVAPQAAPQAAPQPPASNQSGISSFFPQLFSQGRSDAAGKSASVPVQVPGGAKPSPQQDNCDAIQAQQVQAVPFAVGSAPASLMQPGMSSGPDAKGLLRWMSGPTQTPATAQSTAAVAPVMAVMAGPRPDCVDANRAPRNMPSGIAALLQALDSAEAAHSEPQADMDQGSVFLPGCHASETSNMASPVCSTDNSRSQAAPTGFVGVSHRAATIVAGLGAVLATVHAVLPSADSSSSDDSSSPDCDMVPAASDDQAGSCSDQSCSQL